MIKAITHILTVFFAFGLLSCIKDTMPECPPQYSVSIGVKDKNYANVSMKASNQPIDENLPFKAYVSSIYYILQDLSNGNIVSGNRNIVIDHTNKEHSLIFNNIPNGSYELTIWGNTTESSVISTGSGLKTIILHPENQEYTDIYMISDTLVFTHNPQSAHLDLKRTKGLVSVTYKNMPESITQIDQRIEQVAETVDNRLNYSGNTSFTKLFTGITQPEFTGVAFTAPSGNNSTPKLYLTLQKAQSSSIVIPAIDIAVTRNYITPVEIDYNKFSGELEIWTMIDGVWSQVHVMGISDIN